MLSNVSSLMTGQEQKQVNNQNQNELDIASFINLVANSQQVRNIIGSLVSNI